MSGEVKDGDDMSWQAEKEKAVDDVSRGWRRMERGSWGMWREGGQTHHSYRVGLRPLHRHDHFFWAEHLIGIEVGGGSGDTCAALTWP